MLGSVLTVGTGGFEFRFQFIPEFGYLSRDMREFLFDNFTDVVGIDGISAHGQPVAGGFRLRNDDPKDDVERNGEASEEEEGDESKSDPKRVLDTEVSGDTGADTSQDGVIRVAEESFAGLVESLAVIGTRRIRICAEVGRCSHNGDDGGNVLQVNNGVGREPFAEQLGQAGLYIVGNFLIAIRRPEVIMDGLQVMVEMVVGIFIDGEGEAA